MAPIDPAKIREKLMVDEEALQEELLARIQPHLGLRLDGRVYLRRPDSYRQKDAILLYLLGVRFAADAQLRPTDTGSLSEICENLGLDSKVAAARLTDLRNEGKVEGVGRGENRVVLARATAILNEIENTRKAGD